MKIGFECPGGEGFSTAFALKSSKVLSQSFYAVIGFFNEKPTFILVLFRDNVGYQFLNLLIARSVKCRTCWGQPLGSFHIWNFKLGGRSFENSFS
jgi:hypothetical protein